MIHRIIELDQGQENTLIYLKLHERNDRPILSPKIRRTLNLGNQTDQLIYLRIFEIVLLSISFSRIHGQKVPEKFTNSQLLSPLKQNVLKDSHECMIA